MSDATTTSQPGANHVILQRMVARRLARTEARGAETTDWAKLIDLLLPPARTEAA